ncbi:hypothetical protein F5B21DRAFT_501178 [Xylaria acuta]|nr:hypothetical protein F5B21DRAFT_501178 [Xylaria acuta]
MAQAAAIINDAGTAAAMSGIAAATSSERHRRMLLAYYGRGDVDLRSNPTNASFHTTSYMNHLRGPPSPWRDPSSSSGRGGVGVHIHYQGHCLHGPLSYPDDYFAASHSESDAYPYPLTHRASPDPYDAGYHSSPCGCSQCYWRDFVSSLRSILCFVKFRTSSSSVDLTSDIEKYKVACQQLRETYIWNLRELYYVGRVREIYDNHCRHHRLLFHDVCLTWELPEKVTLREESIRKPLSRHSSGSLKSPISPSSRYPTPLPRRDSESRESVEARAVSKGKEKEVIPGLDVDVDALVGSAGNGNDGKGKGKGKANEVVIISPTTTPVAKAQTKPYKLPMQQRLRQLWPTKVRGKSSDKAELAQLVRKDGDTHERDEQESVV